MFDLWILQLIAYLIFGFTIAAYAALDGFDLGVGCLHLFAKNDEERRIFINAIGPVWDGNAVWVILAIGVFFAAFPQAFGTVLPAFYLPIVFLLAGYMFRACAIEFRSKKESKRWRKGWDIAFALSSFVLTISLGLIIGNLVYGIPVDQFGEANPEEFELLNLYSIVVTLFTLSIFMLHGVLYLLMKTEDELHVRLERWVRILLVLFFIFWGLCTILTFIYEPKMLNRFREQPYFLFLVLFSLISIICVPFFVRKESYGKAFISMMVTIVLFVLLFAVGTYPYLAYSTIDPAYSLTIYNSSAGSITLTLVLIISVLGSTLAGFYISYVYKVFRGKVKIDHTSY